MCCSGDKWKTVANLTAGDKLVAFSDGKYESWELDASKHWAQAASRFFITASGTTSNDTTAASLVRMSVGSGIWLQRSASGTSNPFYVYAAHVDDPTTPVSANATVLLGNPTTTSKAPTIDGAQSGDHLFAGGKVRRSRRADAGRARVLRDAPGV